MYSWRTHQELSSKLHSLIIILLCFWSGMRQRVVDPRMYFKVEEEVRSKAEHLKTLRTREKFLQQKLASAETHQEEVL